MAIRNLRYGNDEMLRKRAREIEVIDEKIKILAQDMMDTMHKYEGVGLAGPQSVSYFNKSYISHIHVFVCSVPLEIPD